jgi:signal transduction histidine kinase
MPFTLNGRLTHGLAITLAIGVVSILIVAIGFVHLHRTVYLLADIEGPTLAAAYEMDVKISDYAMAVLRYVDRRDPHEREGAAQHQAAFEHVYRDYVRLVGTDSARVLGERMRQEHDRLRALGTSMMNKRDRRHELFAGVMTHFDEIDGLIDRELQRDPFPSRALRQLQTLLEIETELAELGLLAAKYRPDGFAGRRVAARMMQHVETRLADVSRGALGEGEAPSSAPILEQMFDDLMSDLAQVKTMEAELQTDTQAFTALHQRIDDLLDNEVEAEAIADLRAPRLAADRVTRSVMFLATLLMPAFLFAVAAVSIVKETRLRKIDAELTRQRADRERAEEDRSRLQVALRRSEVLSSLGSIVAGVSHEVRNPLFGISSTVDALEARLKRDRADGKYARHVEVLRGELVRLSKLMHDLLEYGKPPAVDIAESSVADAVGASVAACDAVARSTGATIAINIQPGVEVWPMDRTRMEQVLRNLLENAIQHSPGGTVRLDVQDAFRDGAPYLRVQVRDEGPGFDPAQLAHVFEPFFTRRCGGTGLGLSIVERIVDAHGGAVRASNCATGGAEITVHLPRATPTDSHADVIGAA